MSETKVNGNTEEKHEEEEHDPHYAPIVYLPEVHVSMMEDEEDEMVKLRAKLYRFDSKQETPEWKERGTGEIKLLKHRERASVRVVMRRDKTLKICANHFVAPWMQLKPNCGSERAWVWSVGLDYADEEAKSELLAARFANADDAKKWFDAFELAKEHVKDTMKPPSEFSDAEEDEDSDAESDSGLGSGEKSGDVTKEDEEEASKLADQLSKVSVAEEDKPKVDDKESVGGEVTASGDAPATKPEDKKESSG